MHPSVGSAVERVGEKVEGLLNMDNELKTVKKALPPRLFFVWSVVYAVFVGACFGLLGGFCLVLYVEVSSVSC
jgi:hypothetical protein